MWEHYVVGNFLLLSKMIVLANHHQRGGGVQDTAVVQGGRPDETHRRQGTWLGAVLGNQVCSQLRTNTTNAGVNSGNVARDMCIL